MDRKKPGRPRKKVAQALTSPFSSLLSRAQAPRGRKRTPRKTTPKKAAPRIPAPVAPVDTVVLDDSPVSIDIMDNVKSKVGTFLEVGGFISSEDEDEGVVQKKSTDPPLLVDEFGSPPRKAPKVDTCQPGTSRDSCGTSSSIILLENDSVPQDDIMDFVDLVLENTNEEKPVTLNDIKSLEDFRKETEEMLKNASSFLDEFKTGKKAAPPKQPEESPVKTIGSCPICLESLTSLPAASTVCGHLFHKDCITRTVKSLKSCPTCRTSLNMKKIHPVYF